MTTNDADFSPNMAQHKTVEERLTAAESEIQELRGNMVTVTAALAALGAAPPTNVATAVTLTFNLTSLEETAATTTARGPLLTLVMNLGAPEDAQVAALADELGIPVVYALFPGRDNPAPNKAFYLGREAKGDEVASMGFTGRSLVTLTSLSDADAESELRNSQATLRSWGLSADNLVYPHNVTDARIQSIATKYYKAAAGGGEQPNLTLDNLYNLRRVGLYDNDPLSRYTGFVDQIVASNGWMILWSSSLSAAQVTLLRGIVQYAQGKATWVTMRRGVDLLNGTATSPAPAPGTASVEFYNITKKRSTPVLSLTNGYKLVVDAGDEVTVTPQMIRDYRQVPAFKVIADASKTVSIPYRPGAVISTNDLTVDLQGVGEGRVRARNKTRGWLLYEGAVKDEHVFNRNVADGDTITLEPLPITGYSASSAQDYVMDQDRTAAVQYASTAPVPTAPVTGTVSPPALVIPQGALDLRAWAASQGYSIGQTGTSNDLAGLEAGIAEARRQGRAAYLPRGNYGLGRALVLRDWLNGSLFMDKEAVLTQLSSYVLSGVWEETGLISALRCKAMKMQGGQLVGLPDRVVAPETRPASTFVANGCEDIWLDQIVSRTAHKAAFYFEKSSKIVAQFCTDDYSHGYGLQTENCSDVQFLYNVVDLKVLVADSVPGGIAIFIRNTNGSLVKGGKIINAGGTATKVEGGSNATYDSLTVDGGGRDMIKIMILPGSGVPVKGGTIINCTVSNYRRLEGITGHAFVLQGVVGGKVAGNKGYGPGSALDGTGVGVTDYQGIQSADIEVSDNEVYDWTRGGHIRNSLRIGGTRNKFRSTSGRRTSTGLFLDAANGGTWTRTEFAGIGVDAVKAYQAQNIAFEDSQFSDVKVAWGGSGTNLKATRSTYSGVETVLGGGNWALT